MKKFIASLLLLLVAVPAYAGSGQAVIPAIEAQYNNGNDFIIDTFFITNITDNVLSGKINIYREDGSIFSDDSNPTTGNISIRASSFLSYQEGSGSGDPTITFTLDPHTTGTFSIHMKASPRTSFIGHGIIEWENVTGNNVYGLVAYGRHRLKTMGTGYGFQSEYALLINSGMPF